MPKHAPFTISPPEYQLPATLELGPVKLQVADLARSIDYYERVVGLRVVERGAHSARLAAPATTEVLVQLQEKKGVHAVPARGRIGLYHFAILLPSRIALASFLAHLGVLNEHAGMADHLVSEALYLTDPDGLGIEVYADRPRETWRLDGDAVAMATDPLNVRELLSLAVGNPWQGMPAGTRIGHVHLYVGNLSDSESFYHLGLGLDKVVLQFPGALFMSAGGYHHHLGTNIWAAKSPLATGDDARLLEWTVKLPTKRDVSGAGSSIEKAGYSICHDAGDIVATDRWGTNVRIVSKT
ncbi:MAG: VOC family protein [Gemmatimonadaceae bacterium]